MWQRYAQRRKVGWYTNAWSSIGEDYGTHFVESRGAIPVWMIYAECWLWNHQYLLSPACWRLRIGRWLLRDTDALRALLFLALASTVLAGEPMTDTSSVTSTEASTWTKPSSAPVLTTGTLMLDSVHVTPSRLPGLRYRRYNEDGSEGMISVEDIVRDLAKRGEVCKAFGHQWTAKSPNYTLALWPERSEDMDVRDCRICARREWREWREAR